MFNTVRTVAPYWTDRNGFARIRVSRRHTRVPGRSDSGGFSRCSSALAVGTPLAGARPAGFVQHIVEGTKSIMMSDSKGIVMPYRLSLTRLSLVLLFALAGLTTFGCAHAAAPMRVRYADIDKGVLEGYTGAAPLIIEFQPGERVPVNFELTGEGFELQPQHPPLELVATQRCFLRISAEGLRLGPDPDHLDSKPSQPGTFRVGFWKVRGQPAKVDIVITAPRR
jgi:hypothetical protein